MTRTELNENFLLAMDTIRARKGRSALTVLGIVIGVTSVISVAAIIEGLNRHVADKVNSLGSYSLIPRSRAVESLTASTADKRGLVAAPTASKRGVERTASIKDGMTLGARRERCCRHRD